MMYARNMWEAPERLAFADAPLCLIFKFICCFCFRLPRTRPFAVPKSTSCWTRTTDPTSADISSNNDRERRADWAIYTARGVKPTVCGKQYERFLVEEKLVTFLSAISHQAAITHVVLIERYTENRLCSVSNGWTMEFFFRILQCFFQRNYRSHSAVSDFISEKSENRYKSLSSYQLNIVCCILCCLHYFVVFSKLLNEMLY